MPDPDEYYPVNTLPPVTLALHLYFKKGGPFKQSRVVELMFPSGEHKEMMRSKGPHEILIWISDRQVYARGRCTFKRDCDFNSERIEGSDREGLKTIDWSHINNRKFFKLFTRWILKLDLDFVLFVRALVTVCDRVVETPLTTQYGKTFEKFNEYRSEGWPEDLKPDRRAAFLEELLVRVSFWFQTAATVGALRS